MRRQIVVEDPGSRVRVKAPKSPNGFRTLMLDVDTLKGLTGGGGGAGAIVAVPVHRSNGSALAAG